MLKKVIIVLSLIIVIGGVAWLYKTVPQNNEIRMVTMINNNGEESGIIKLSETKAGVLLALNISGLKPNGEHAFHVHETGDCTPLDSFSNAGGHYNPHGKSHGMHHPEGHHAGDMPNLKPNSEGKIATHVLNRQVTLSNTQSEDDRAPLFDDDGSSIVIHAAADDHVSQPSGAAGPRILCGVINP